MTPWVLRLLLATGAVFLLQMAQFPIGFLVFDPQLLLRQPWTVVTYTLIHGGLGHIFFNMLALFFFGPRLEARLGSSRFLILYALAGAVGALLSMAFAPRVSVIGASGSVFGVMLGFARYWPRDQILIWGIFPVEARWLVAGMTVLALLGGFGQTADGIAHFAHLGGFVGGWLALKFFETTSPAQRFRKKATAPRRPREPRENPVSRWSRIRREGLHEVNRAELDRILDKISSQGVESLTASDREFLERFSAREST